MRRLLVSFAGIVLSLSVTASAWADSPGISDSYYRTFYQTGEVEYGKIDDSYTADLVIYIDNSQYNVFDNLIQGFLGKNPDINTIYIASGSASTILANWILEQGYIDSKKTARNPDLFISANPEHFQQMKAKQLIRSHSTYAQGRPALMVAKGYPVDSIELKQPISKKAITDYKIVELNNNRNIANAKRFLDYLSHQMPSEFLRSMGSGL